MSRLGRTIFFQRRRALGRSKGLEVDFVDGCALPMAYFSDVIGEFLHVEVACNLGNTEAALGLL